MSEGKDIKKPKNALDSLNFAIEGIIHAFREERHMRYHFAIAGVALLLTLILRIPALEFGLFALSIVILLFAEMVNTAIEEVVNLVEEKYNIFARNAKDIAAGAVLISSFGVIIMFYIIFTRHIYDPMEKALYQASHYTGHLSLITLLLVLILVVAIKAHFGKGRPLHGGLPSGHSALAFAMGTAITLITLNLVVAILALFMAVMVSHSRLIGKIHTTFEIFVGALLGIGVTCLIFWFFSLTMAAPTP